MKLIEFEKANNAMNMFVSMAKCIDGESTRFIGVFKHEKNRAYKDLLTNLESFLRTVESNIDTENIKSCEILQDYLHKTITDEIEIQKRSDIDVFCVINKMLKIIYEKYLNGFKHDCKQNFINLYKSANFFANLIGYKEAIKNDFEYFCVTLIEGNEYTKTI
jgi:hypothetical protein